MAHEFPHKNKIKLQQYKIWLQARSVSLIRLLCMPNLFPGFGDEM